MEETVAPQRVADLVKGHQTEFVARGRSCFSEVHILAAVDENGTWVGSYGRGEVYGFNSRPVKRRGGTFVEEWLTDF